MRFHHVFVTGVTQDADTRSSSMASENKFANIAVSNDESDQQFNNFNLTDEKHDAIYPSENTGNRRNPVGSRLGSLLKTFEQQLVEYNLEARGIERVAPEERMKRLSWLSYLQAFLLWVSINLAANNITLGMLGPAVFGLSFLDSALCAVLGAFVGSVGAAWMATWGPVSGIRTMVCIIPHG